MMQEPQPKTYADHALFLNVLREGVEIRDGKTIRRPAHSVEQDIVKTVTDFLLARGEFFRAAYPYYFDRVAHELIRLDSATPELFRILREMGLLAGQKHTEIVTRNLRAIGDVASERTLHRFAFMGDTATYIRHSRATMLKITADTIEEVDLGTDGVILIANDLPDWPSLATLQPHIDDLHPQVGNTCTRLLPGLPMTDLLTTRWSQESVFRPEQAHQMFISWLLFPVAASEYTLWPILVNTGPQNSGKSTPLELLIAAWHGRYIEATALPKKDRDLTASATNRSLLIYDNIDEVQARDYDNFICNLSTGAEVDLARLYETNTLATFQLRNHVGLTARINPFTRSDVMRRMIVLDVAPSQQKKTVDKAKLIRAVLAQRDRILAEYILRAQNILRAHQCAGDEDYEFQSQMGEYEAFTLRCADYEGTSAATRAIWSAYMRQYERSVTESNPLVFACRLWLGKGGNAGRQVSPATLFSELQAIYEDTDQVLTYRSPSAFGIHVAKNKSALEVIGFGNPRTKNGNDYVFHPQRGRTRPLRDHVCGHVHRCDQAVG